MATTFAEMVATVTADVSDFNKKMDTVEKAIGNATKPFDAIGEVATGAFRRIGELGINAIGSTIGALGDLGKSVVGTGVNFNNMMEQSEIAFGTMLDSGQMAKSFLDELQAFAAKTPFEFPELTQAAQRMLAMGFESNKVLPTLTAIGDAVAGLGGSSALVDRVTTALGQMQAKGKASGEEMMQLTEAGIPAWQMLADKIGVDIPTAMKQVSAGAISADVAIGALVEGMNTKFGGMMEKQSATFGGLFSTIKDTFAQVSGQVIGPVFKQLTAGLQWIVDFTNTPEFTAGVASFAKWIEKVTEKTVAWAIDAWPKVKSALSSVYNALQMLVTGDFRGGIFGLQEDHPFIVALLAGRNAAKWLYDATVTLIARTREWLDGVLTPLGSTIGNTIEGLTKFGGQLMATLKPIADNIAKFVKLDDVLTALGLLMAGPVIGAIVATIGSFLSFAAPIAGLIAAVAALRWAWQNDFLGIQTFTKNALDKISKWFYEDSGIWKGTWEETLEYLKWWASGGWKLYILAPLSMRLQEIAGSIRGWALGTVVRFKEWVQDVKDIVAGWKTDIQSKFDNWYDIVKGVIDDFIGLGDDIYKWYLKTKQTIKDWKDDTVDKFEEWRDDVIYWFEDVFDWWKPDEWLQTGKDIVQGLWDGMEWVWDQLMIWWNGVWGKDLTKTVKVEMKTHSPSKVMEELGGYTIEGFAIGADKAMPMVYDAMSALSTASMSAGSGAGAGSTTNTSRIEELLTILIAELRAKNMTANVTVAGGGSDIASFNGFLAGSRI